MKKWTLDEEQTGRKFLASLHNFSGGFKEKRDQAARSIGYVDGYMGMPSGVRSYISHVGQEAKRAREAYDAEMNTPAEIIAQMEEEWWRLYDTDPEFRHAMTHPDDE